VRNLSQIRSAAARTPGTDSSTYDADYARRMPSELY
jgi:hypothetical protein